MGSLARLWEGLASLDIPSEIISVSSSSSSSLLSSLELSDTQVYEP